MRRVVDTAGAGKWPATDATERVTLGYEDRVRRRMRLESDSGGAFLLDLSSVVRLVDGDGLRLDDGTWIGVRAAPEPVIEVACETPDALARIAWHLGNRHVPAQITAHAVRFRDDPVIKEMIEGLGAKTRFLMVPFQPESGAYHRHEHNGHSHG